MTIRIAFGHFEETVHPDGVKAALAEFISTLLFVFAGVGSVMAFGKLQGSEDLSPTGLVAVALTHAFAIFVTISIAANISGGHVNPAVTLSLCLTGQITVIRSILYWIAQLVGAVVGCYLLKLVTNGLDTPGHSLGAHESAFEGVICEIIITFGLVYTIFATVVDPKRESLATIAPLCIGFIVGANILAAGPFSGGSMNPARSFGPAFVSGSWKNQWVYWVGPLIGGALAAVVYDSLFLPTDVNPPLSTEC
eukprot:c43171_g1_i1 orf=311-1063(+)